MFKLKSPKEQNTEQTINKHALIFGLISVFLIGIGFSIITPVIPFLVQPYINDPSNQAIVVTLLMSVYAICMFFAAPVLGALSDRYGRRPLLLVSLLGASIGFFIFGIGGALWVLFAGRIIEGITGGSISTIFAYFADITPREQRTKYFGWVGAMAGAGSVMGPTIGGLLATHFGYAAPLYFGAIIALLNVVYGFFFMPESLDKKNRLQEIKLTRLNPFTQLFEVLSIKNLNRLLIAAFLLWIPNGSMQAILSQFTIDTFSWKPALIGLVFSIIGFQDIISQAFIMPQLLKKLSDKQIAILGMIAEITGYVFIAASTLLSTAPLFIIGIFIFGFGDSIFGPSFNGMLSKSADASEQGRIQGGSQSIQALARIIGPIIGGFIYVRLGHAAPAVMAIVLIAVAVLVLYRSKLVTTD
ncbi:Permease of the major facilitator superfamily protein [Listeria grandensis FSL F6-0971]|uniref:Permease of the major facilitator superfamily protein n=1 Tax=Listeria grandensis FSL F6-0971 TaxID=1265819 RepID=W7BES7_9LIST|nr:tetracycline resistance MFS efflux pump [Listeria grandensis]EUJ23305.1 Permease of the major facilitator superfamily protein [Listeria grandensis FSL F6-0971]